MVTTSLHRRAFALAGTLLALALVGCAADDGAIRSAPGANGNGNGIGILTPWSTIHGGWLGRTGHVRPDSRAERTQMSSRAQAVVIGAGLGGLAAAVRLLEQGYAVTVVERREGLGGRASQLKDRGYTFDMGPSLITMPWLAI